MITIVGMFYSGDVDAYHINCLPVESYNMTSKELIKFFLENTKEDIIKEFPHLKLLWPRDIFKLTSWSDWEYNWDECPYLAYLERILGYYENGLYFPFNWENIYE